MKTFKLLILLSLFLTFLNAAELELKITPQELDFTANSDTEIISGDASDNSLNRHLKPIDTYTLKSQILVVFAFFLVIIGYFTIKQNRLKKEIQKINIAMQIKLYLYMSKIIVQDYHKGQLRIDLTKNLQ